MKLSDVKQTVCEVFEISEDKLQPDTVLENLEEYDSVKILTLMVALDDIGIPLSQSEVAMIRTYGDIEQHARNKGVLS